MARGEPRRGRILLSAAAGAATAAASAALAVRATGQRIARQHDPELDALLSPPEEVTHHRLPSYDGGSLHVVEHGSGPPVVLLHGVTLQWQVWSALFHLLGEDHRVIAWDMRGHGESHAGDAGVAIEAVATDLVTLLSELDARDAVLVGHSMGGMALGRFCIDHPVTRDRRVAHAVYLATTAAPLHPVRTDPQGPWHVRLTALATRGMEGRLRYDWQEGDLSRVLIRPVFGRKATAKAVEEVRKMVAEMSPESLLDAGRAVAAHDIRSELLDVPTPSTVIVGTHDRLTPPRHARTLAGSLMHAEVHVLEGVGHQPMQEAPHELAAHLRSLTRV